MIRIAVCDDDSEQLSRLANMTGEYIKTRALDAEITQFSHPDALLTAIGSESFHLYILDIVMPLMSGLDLGKEIRRLDREAQIIFVTTEPQFALQAFASNPINYLIKPVVQQRLFDTLTLAISKTDLAEEQTFTFKTAGSLRVIKHSYISCCEYRNHAVVLSLTNGEELVSKTIRESFSECCAAVLKDRHFLQCHAAFIINMRRVERFSKDSFTLCGGKVIPIAAKQYPAVRDTYMDYLMARSGQ